jgi:hypothetical protein
VSCRPSKGFRGHADESAQLDAGDADIADHGEHLDLFLKQIGLLFVVILAKPNGRKVHDDATGLATRDWQRCYA